MQRTKKKKKALRPSKNGERRYPISKCEEYQKVYSLLLRKSRVINSEARSTDFVNAFIMSGKGEIRATIHELVGNSEGFYTDRYGNTVPALIPAAKRKLKQIWRQFKNWQNQQVREGYSMKKPKEWPANLLHQRHRAEAYLDVREHERFVAEIALENLEKQEKIERQNKVLENGLLFSGSVESGEIDGQRISHTDSGIPFIDEPTSPYNRMPVFHYRKLCDKWKTKHRLHREQLREDGKKMFAKLKAEHQAESDRPFPHSKLSFTWRQMLKRRLEEISESDYPKFPKGVKKINEL